ncbi:hypothetical protein EVJ58_g4917 [Rhodofomes roseus]|uniref:Uncharacterized protein n=1 Tax=Rhodofomes roseus TaxID=34475 RepID=A0A4Y9YIM0_9APHY|nr:hypothetical protein EVJ58_g4917 [Rhodofomes roseus]
MLSTSFPSPAHLALSDSERAAHPNSFVSEVDNAVLPRVRFHHTGDVYVRGIQVLAFCRTIASPEFESIARQVRRLDMDFEDVRPTRAGLEMVANALAAMSNLDELVLLGLPSREADGWVLRKVTGRLRLFCTNLSIVSWDMLDFLRRQQDIVHLGTRSPPASEAPMRNAYQHMPFPTDVVPRLRTLDSPAPVLLSLQAASPPTRPLTHMRIDLNKLHPNVESEALKALAAFSSTVKRLSLCRSALRLSPASDRSGAMCMASVINRIAMNRRWAKLEFLEMRDESYDASAIPGLSQAISRCCPAVETIVWAPSTHPAGSTASAACIAIIFFTFSRHLRQFIFLDDASDPANKKYLSVAKQQGGELRAVPVGATEVEGMWKQS